MEKRMILIGAVVGAIVISCIIGGVVYASMNKQPSPVIPLKPMYMNGHQVFENTFVYQKKCHFEDLTKECAQHNASVPLYAIYQQEGNDLYKSLADAITDNLKRLVSRDDAKDDDVLLWTGGYVHMSSPENKMFIKHAQDDKNVIGRLDALKGLWCANKNLPDSVLNKERKESMAGTGEPYRKVHLVFRYSNVKKSVCLDLHDADYGKTKPRERSELFPVCQAVRSPQQPCNENCGDEPQPFFYFPRIVDTPVRYEESGKMCTKMYDTVFTLSGRDQANENFLNDTAGMLAGITGAHGVWIGGHFDLSSQYPLHVHWHDGNVSDSEKSPPNIWCGNKLPKNVLDKAIKDYHPLSKSGLSSKVPIVRLKSDSACLTPYLPELYWPSGSAFASLCVTNEPMVSLQTTTKLIYPKVFEGLYDEKDRAFSHMLKKVKEGFNEKNEKVKDAAIWEKLPFAIPGKALVGTSTYDVKALWISFPVRTTLTMARKICQELKIENEPKPDGTMTDRQAFMKPLDVQYAYANQLLFDTQQMQRFPYVLKSVIHSTAAHFDFLPSISKNNGQPLNIGFSDNVPSNITAIDSVDHHFAQELANGTKIIKDRENLGKTLNEQRDLTFSEFKEWYNQKGGKQTTGPKKLPVGFVAGYENPDVFKPCLYLMKGELYWPGHELVIPVCQKPITQ